MPNWMQLVAPVAVFACSTHALADEWSENQRQDPITDVRTCVLAGSATDDELVTFKPFPLEYDITVEITKEYCALYFWIFPMDDSFELTLRVDKNPPFAVTTECKKLGDKLSFQKRFCKIYDTADADRILEEFRKGDRAILRFTDNDGQTRDAHLDLTGYSQSFDRCLSYVGQ
jgi:hypothetical protein